jgi:hypothetical protein
MTIWGKLLAYSCILFLNWYQLGEIPCFKGLRGGWFPRKRDKDFILKLLVRWETRINSAQKLNRRNSKNHQNRYAPRIFYHRLLGQLPQDDRTFYTVQFGLTAELIQQLKATKLDISMTYRLKMPKRRSSSFGVYFIQLPTAISMCQFCRNPRTQPSCGRRVWNGYYPRRCWKNRSC